MKFLYCCPVVTYCLQKTMIHGFVTTELLPKVVYNAICGTWHYLAVSEDTVVFVVESGNMSKKNTESMDIYAENIHIDSVK